MGAKFQIELDDETTEFLSNAAQSFMNYSLDEYVRHIILWHVYKLDVKIELFQHLEARALNFQSKVGESFAPCEGLVKVIDLQPLGPYKKKIDKL